MDDQKTLTPDFISPVDRVEKFRFEPIKGYPMLHWKGKRPFESTQFYPSQLKEAYGQEFNGWFNRIYWGDNLQVMSHLLKEFRGKVDLIYIDPPYDSKAEYKKKIEIRSKSVSNDHSAFEEKQYTDLWTNDEYLQFMYERILLSREILADAGVFVLHCDYHKNHYLRLMLDEVFGQECFVNEIVWKRRTGSLNQSRKLGASTDTLLVYSKSVDSYTYNPQFTPYDDNDPYIKSKFVYKEADGRIYRLHAITSPSYSPSLVYEYKGYKPPANGWAFSMETMEKWERDGKLYFPKDKNQRIQRKQYLDEMAGKPVQSLWDDIRPMNSQAIADTKYPTQKPEELLKRIVEVFSNPGDLVFDSFMGSGTTQAVALKTGRRFIGSDINLGAVQTTTKRLLGITKSIDSPWAAQNSIFEGVSNTAECWFNGFQVYNVNHYDFFRNELEAKELLIKALEVQPLLNSSLYDGEKDGRMVKILPINRIATRADLNELITNFDQKTFEKRQNENPNKPVEYLTLVCMGHEPDLAAQLQAQMKPFKIDVEVVDILRDKSKLEFKRDAEAEIVKDKGKVVIKEFYPMNLLQKLSLDKQNVGDWRELVESVMIDFNYSPDVLEPTLVDIPERDELVNGSYEIPKDAGTIRIKITDLLSESLEMTLNG